MPCHTSINNISKITKKYTLHTPYLLVRYPFLLLILYYDQHHEDDKMIFTTYLFHISYKLITIILHCPSSSSTTNTDIHTHAYKIIQLYTFLCLFFITTYNPSSFCISYRLLYFAMVCVCEQTTDDDDPPHHNDMKKIMI